jgi:membrane protein DedA with SNARE-associated domain
MQIRKILEAIATPLIFLLIAVSLLAAWRIFNLPPEQELLRTTGQYFNLYGSWIVFASAFLEGVLFAGWYYPGSLVLFLGIIFAGNDLKRIILVVLLAITGAIMAYIFNYGLGKYGWHRLFLKAGLKKSIEHAQENLSKHALNAILLTYWQPNFAAITSTAAGILHFPFKKFLLYSISATFIWAVFWTLTVYFLGEKALTFVGIKFVFIIGAAWIALRLLALRKKEN